MNINLIGAGRLGKNLALALYSNKDMTLSGVYNRSLQSAQAAVAAIGAGNPIANLNELPHAELLFITTPDDEIEAIVSRLIKDNIVSPKSMVVHCSGVLNSDVLKPLKDKGCYIASIHPLKAFSAELQQEAFGGCDCVVEGDANVVELLTVLFTGFGAQVMTIDAAKKSTYHAAAVIASNYLVTLAGCAVKLLQEVGLSQEKAHHMTQNLMQSSLNNIKKTTHLPQSLTGPLMRGDLKTIALHLNAIDDPAVNILYRAAALATLPLTTLTEETKAGLISQLTC